MKTATWLKETEEVIVRFAKDLFLSLFARTLKSEEKALCREKRIYQN